MNEAQKIAAEQLRMRTPGDAVDWARQQIKTLARTEAAMGKRGDEWRGALTILLKAAEEVLR